MWFLVSLCLGADPWTQTLHDVLDSVVVVQMDRVRPFDGETQSSAEASGFVVDAERGLILTNRHVVTAGPLRAQGIFANKEEVELIPVYADPVHDFGIFQYNPEDLEFISPRSLPLVPAGAKVGADIRVIGNDAAEQLSILAGTLSRLDRAAPYWDFNTFYLQAASSTSGGSSGSPVFDVEGRVVALNAGARTDAATSLFLPLERVVVALDAIREGETPPRGTLQTVLHYQTFDELRRLGLTPALEREVRARWDGTGMLTVARVNPGGPAVGKLREGDIVVGLNGVPVHSFVPFEAVVDGSVGGSVRVELLRGGQPVEAVVEVQDLDDLTPRAYMELGEGVLYPLGYRAAVGIPRPVRGVAVGRAGRLLASAGIGTSAIIEGIGGVPVFTLDDVVTGFAQVADGESVEVQYSDRNEPTRKRVATVRMNRYFWPFRVCERRAADWPCRDVDIKAAHTGSIQQVHLSAQKGRQRRAAQSLVTVSFRPMLNIDSAPGDQRTSVGVLLSRDGLVLTDRNAVPISTGEVRVQVGDAPSVGADIEYMDPIHNIGLIRVHLEELSLPEDWRPPELAFTEQKVGAPLTAIALDKEGQVYSQKMKVGRVVSGEFGSSRYPRFVERDIDLLRLGTLDRPTRGGVLTNRRGEIIGLIQRFAHDTSDRLQTKLGFIDLRTALQSLADYRAKRTEIPTLGVDLRAVNLVRAREEGVPAAVAARLAAHRPKRTMVLKIDRISGDAPARTQLQVGDWIVGAAGQPVGSFAELEESVRAGVGELQVVRDREEISVHIKPLMLPVGGTQKVALWAGMLVQDAHPAVALYSQTPSEGVYLSWYYGGTPAQRYNTGYGRRLVAVDGVRVPDLEGFLTLVRGRKDRSSLRLRLQGLGGEEWVTTLRLDLKFWPTQVFERTDTGWVRTEDE